MILPFIFDAAPNRIAPWLYEFFEFVKMQSRERYGAIIAQEEYIRPVCEWKAAGRSEADGELIVSHKISQEEIDKVNFYALPKNLFHPLREQTGSLSNAAAFLAEKRYEPLETWLYEIFKKIEADSGEKMNALIMFRQYRSIDVAAQKYGIKIFYYDAGTFRNPVYRNTIYLDTYGHCTHCGIERRYADFCTQIQEMPRNVFLTNKEILALMLEPAYKDKIQLLDQSSVFACGVAQQSDIITLMLSQTHTSNADLTVLARENFPASQILVRGAPGAAAASLEMQLDDSPFAIDFIAKCDCIFTRASNMAFEALLMGKQVYSMERGLYQFKGMQSANYPGGCVENDPAFLDFVAFAFYIPREFLYDPEYLKWRLSEPSEAEIYIKNLEYYLHCRGLSQEVLQKEKASRWIEILWKQGFDSLGQPLEKIDSEKMTKALYALSQIRESSPYQELYANVMKTVQQYAVLHCAFTAMQRETNTLHGYVKELEERSVSAAEEITKSHDYASELERKFVSAEEEIAKLRDYVGELEGKSVSSTEEMKKLRDYVGELEGKSVLATEEIAKLRDCVSELEGKSVSDAEEITKSHGYIQELEERSAETAKTLETANEYIHTLEEEIKVKSAAIEEMQNTFWGKLSRQIKNTKR